MHDVKFLADHFQLSERAVNRRLAALQTALGPLRDAYVTRGKVDKYLVTNNGLSLLGRMLQLEGDGLIIEEAAKRVQHELGDMIQNGQENERSSPAPLSADSRQASSELVAALRETLELLKTQIGEKDRQIERLQDIMQNRLPGRVDPQAQEAFDLNYLQRTIQAQREEIEAFREEIEELKTPWWRRIRGSLHPQRSDRA